MSGDRQARVTVSIPRLTLARVDRLAAHLDQSRSATVDDCLNLAMSNFAFIPADETPDARD